MAPTVDRAGVGVVGGPRIQWLRRLGVGGEGGTVGEVEDLGEDFDWEG